PPSRSGAAPRPNDWPWWLLPLFIGLAARVAVAATNYGLTMDSGLYADMAENLARGHLEPLGPAHHGYPALIALACLVVRGREWPGRLVSFAAGLALIPVVYLLARRSLPARWSAMAATLVALHPLLVVYSGAIMTETTFLVLAYGALLMLERSRFAWGGA